MPRRAFRTLAALLLAGALAGALDAATRLGTPVRRFASPGNHPEGIAWDGAHLWVNNFTDGSLAEMDPVSGNVLRSVRQAGLPVNPEGLAWDGTHLWTVDWQTGNITKLLPTPTTLQIAGVWPKPADSGGPVGLEWDGSHLWLATWGPIGSPASLWQLDPTTLATVRTVQTPVFFLEDLAWDGRWLWSCDWLSRKGFAIDPATGDTLHTYRTPGPNPVGQAWDGTYLWIGDTTSDSLWALDISAAYPNPVRAVSWSEVKRLYVGRE